jgi:hypothetical protein
MRPWNVIVNIEDEYQGVIRGLRWEIFLSIHNNQINAPISKYFYPLSYACLCLLLLFSSLFCLVSSFKCTGLDA